MYMIVNPPQPQLDSFYGYCALIVISLEAGGCCPCDWNVMCPADQWTLVFCCSWCSVYCISNCTGAVYRKEPLKRNYTGEKSQEEGERPAVLSERKGGLKKGQKQKKICEEYGAEVKDDLWGVSERERLRDTIKEQTATRTDCRLK